MVWPGGEHEFALRLGEMRRLQESCDAGPEEILNRLRRGGWRVNDLIEPLRLGLIGSGAMTNSEAGPFVTQLFEQHPLAEFRIAALAVMAHALYGPADDMPEKHPGATKKNRASGDSAKSTVPAA